MQKTNTNYLIANSQAMFGYIDESTPCGKAKAKQVKADLEQLAIMLEDSHLTDQTKRAIKLDYINSMRKYIEREEECSDCTNEECDYYEEEELPDIEDMDNFVISVNGMTIECDCYEDTINKVMLLEALGFGYDVYGYDSEEEEYPCRVIDNGNGLSLEIDN